ncbi:MAG: DNA-binding transcriptional LysR family regulator [Verrucomicrobiales bacterium]|jgi:DNA-binding transcriptional LysR family regulator
MPMPLSASFPDLTALDLYASVVELGSLGRAARTHGIAQPSASSRIRNLERQLGVTLLTRSPSGSVPTPEGVVISGWTDAILRAAHELEAGLAALKAEQVGRLRIVASYTIAEYLLPGWLGRFTREHPGDTVALDVKNSTHVLVQLERGDADIGFIETPTPTPTMSEAVVGHDQLVAVVPPGHPWAQIDSVEMSELVETPLVMREQGSGTREALEQALQEAGHGLPVSVLELGSTSAVRSAVLSGNSPTVISRLAVANELLDGQLVEVEVRDLTIERDLRAVWPTGKPLPKLAQALLADLT